jgi:RNA polymerase sigma-70 factor (ECF subfamily)
MATTAIPTTDFLPGVQTAHDQPVRLVDRAKKGEQQAFANLFHAHSRRIHSVSLQITNDTFAAENLTRDIFVEAFTNLDAIGDDNAFASWLHRHAVIKMIASRAKS